LLERHLSLIHLLSVVYPQNNWIFAPLTKKNKKTQFLLKNMLKTMFAKEGITLPFF
jgi:hypothetical protein